MSTPVLQSPSVPLQREARDLRRGVDGHVVGRVVEELGTRVALDVVRVKVAPATLHVDPVLVARRAVEHVLGVRQERRARHVPLVRREEEDVGARRVHLVRFSRVDRLLLHRLDRETLELLVENLTNCFFFRQQLPAATKRGYERSITTLS